MKWSKKGEELDDRAELLTREFADRKQIMLFGAGQRGAELRRILERYDIFGGFIDNDPAKQTKGLEQAKVYSLEEYQSHGMRDWIVVSASDSNAGVIMKQLEAAGYKHETDFWQYEEFVKDVFPMLSFYHFQKLFVFLAQISVTERCTLHCRKCAHACHRVSISADDMTLEMAKESADYFFSNVDVVNEFVLIGGEPFLYADLEKLVDYIGNNYREKMLMFAITTNGTILPSDEMVKLCKKHRVTVRVSDYSDTIPQLQPRYELLYHKLSGVEVIVWKTQKENCWFDYGFEEMERGEDASLITAVFDRCRTDCREIRGSRYYYCVMARSVPENMGWGIGADDFLELRDLKDKKFFFEYQQGYSKKGYLDLCRHCRGAEAPHFLIPAAEQI